MWFIKMDIISIMLIFIAVLLNASIVSILSGMLMSKFGLKKIMFAAFVAL